MAKRIFFGSSALAVKSKYVSGFNVDGTETTTEGNWTVPRGIQSVGFSTSVAFEPMFQLGQTEVYGRMETQSPQVECTISKAIDGSQMLYTTVNGGHTAANNKAPAELAGNQVQIALGVYAESVPYASGNTQAAVHCSGMYVSNVQIQLPLDGVATEQLTLVGDTRRWLDSTNPIAANLGSSTRDVIGSGSAPSSYQRWTLDKDGSSLPLGVSGSKVLMLPWQLVVKLFKNLEQEESIVVMQLSHSKLLANLKLSLVVIVLVMTEFLDPTKLLLYLVMTLETMLVMLVRLLAYMILLLMVVQIRWAQLVLITEKLTEVFVTKKSKLNFAEQPLVTI